MKKTNYNRIVFNRISLLSLIITTSLFVAINDLIIGISAFLFSSILFLIQYVINKKIIYKKLFFSILIINSIYMIIGNWLFSPEDYICKTIRFLFFKINTQGFENGVIGALKRDSMIILSFVWLNSVKSMKNIYDTLSIFPYDKYKYYLNIFLKVIIYQKYKLQIQFYSLSLRGIIKKTSNIHLKFYQANLLLKSLFNRFFYDIGKLTFAGESHFCNERVQIDSSPHIELKDISVKYDGKYAIKNLNFEVKKKSFIIVNGRNKSGKTTLLRVISGYIPTIIGELYGLVSVCDITFSDNVEIKDISNNVKYIMDDPDDYIVGLTVKDEILLHTKDVDYAIKCLKLMQIYTLWDQDTYSLSGGEKIRLVLASLLASRVKIILLDSVLSQLDKQGRNEFIEALSKFYKKNDCIIIVTDYYPEYYLKLADRSIVLDCGSLITDESCFFKKHNIPTNKNILEMPNSNFIINSHFANQKNIIELKGIKKQYGEKTVLDDFNFQIRKHERICLVGTNGSGKTTAMLILAGLVKPDYGERILFSENLHIGFVFQNANMQIVGTTIEDELSIGPKLQNWSQDKKQNFIQKKNKYFFRELNESTLFLHPNELKMLAFHASDLNLNLMIFDEPTIYMDYDDKINFNTLLEELKEADISVAIISHDYRIIKNCDRIINFNKRGYPCTEIRF